MANRDEEPGARIERLIGEGKITREAVEAAEKLWEERLRYGITMPNGETAIITLNDLYHVIVDDRIWRKVYRIERLLLGVFEIRTARLGRRVALSQWEEAGKVLFGRAILDVDSSVRSMHLIDARKLRRERAVGDLLWRL